MTPRTLLLIGSLALTACTSHARYGTLEAPPTPVADVVATVYLVGDAGLASPGRDAVLAALREDVQRRVSAHPTSPAVIAFLGDNIYDVGARGEYRSEDLAKLSPQVRAVSDAATVQGIFVPGNHDWGAGASDRKGRNAIEVQQRWIEEIEGSRNVRFLPNDECPGPAGVHVGADVHVLFIDTEWLLRLPNDDCGSAEQFYDRLAAELERLAGQRVILAAHHPMATGGPHGGNVGIFDSGPVVYFLAVKSGLSIQDLASGRYEKMLEGLRSAIDRSGHRPLAMAAGHDHSLQVIRLEEPDLPMYQLVSGSASKSSRVRRIDGTRFATARHGYLRIDFTRGASRVVAYGVGSANRIVRALFACELSTGELDSCAEAPLADEGS